MHWFGELLFICTTIIGAGFAFLYVMKIPAYRAQRHAAEAQRQTAALKYVTREAWLRAWRQLHDANASAIACIEAGLAPGFPEDVRDELLAAHEAAGEVMTAKGARTS